MEIFKIMSFRTKILIVIIAAVLVVGGLIGFLIWRSYKTKQAAVPPPAGQLPAAPAPSATSGIPTAPAPKLMTPVQLNAAAREVAIKNRARDFVERFGSYSKDANYANLEELQPMITAPVAKWLEQYPRALKEKEPAGFIGVSTFVVTQKILSSSEIRAEVMVSAQREETTVSGASRYYKDILVKMVFTGDMWKVDGAYWQQ